MKEYIQPGVLINGQIYYPPGWMYVLAFALAGCQWAIDEIENSGWLNEGAYI